VQKLVHVLKGDNEGPFSGSQRPTSLRPHTCQKETGVSERPPTIFSPERATRQEDKGLR
jgi:hypothetical protein